MSLFYIIGGTEDLFSTFRHIYDFKNHEIKSEILINGQVDLCSSSKALVRLAYNLFSGYEDEYTTSRDLFYRLAENTRDFSHECSRLRARGAF